MHSRVFSLNDFNDACGALFAEETLGSYRLRWTGLKGVRDDSFLVGQWLGWPEKGTPTEDARYFCQCVGATWGGEYRPGEAFDMAGTPEGRIDLAMVSDPGSHARMLQLILDGREQLMDLLRAAGVVEVTG